MSKPAPRLGKGLHALLGSRAAALPRPPHELDSATPATHSQPLPREIPLAAIDRNITQPRVRFDDASLNQLAESIRTNGVLQPILVRPASDGRFQIVAGERRWRAAERAGLRTIPAIVRAVDDAQAIEIALVENVQREDLGPLERAAAYQNYLNYFHATPDQLAIRLGESRANIANYLRLMRLPGEIQQLIESGQLAMGQARAVAGISDPQRQLAVARMAVRRELSVRQVESLARLTEESPATQPEVEEQTRSVASRRHFGEVERAFTSALGARVQLTPAKRKNAGRIIITYNGLEEFERIAQRLGVSLRPE
ncbi:Chromosome-partitioning protein ParB [Phycisphaerae bacterium RAS1]|nr:Chromosome-partitioning protein ParB [Phycisphaerae bacterium RAS1]